MCYSHVFRNLKFNIRRDHTPGASIRYRFKPQPVFKVFFYDIILYITDIHLCPPAPSIKTRGCHPLLLHSSTVFYRPSITTVLLLLLLRVLGIIIIMLWYYYGRTVIFVIYFPGAVSFDTIRPTGCTKMREPALWYVLYTYKTTI